MNRKQAIFRPADLQKRTDEVMREAEGGKSAVRSSGTLYCVESVNPAQNLTLQAARRAEYRQHRSEPARHPA